MQKKVMQKAFIVILAIILSIATLQSSLLVFATEYSGTGGANTPVSSYADYKFNAEDHGIRIYCVDKDKHIKKGSGVSVVDLWTGVKTPLAEIASSYYSTRCRIGGEVSTGDIYFGSFSDGKNLAETRLKNAGKLGTASSLSTIPSFAYYNGSGDFVVSGETFKNWATHDVTHTAGTAWEVTLLFYGITGIPMADTDFIVMEPLIYLPIISGPSSNQRLQCDSACTFYGMLNQLANCGPDSVGGDMKRVKAAWGSGFKLSTGMAGLTAPTTDFDKDWTLGSLGNIGWGLHILKSLSTT